MSDNTSNMRTFTVTDTESQMTKEIRSDAKTIADLKRDLRQNGFNVEGKIIQEGLTRIEFKDDSSLLPHDVPCKGGGITNDLVFRLTKINKQVKSGNTMSRTEAYAQIKKFNLGDAVKAKFGKNFTQCSTNDLVSFIESHKGTSNTPTKPETVKKEEPAPVKKEAPKAESHKECECKVLIKNLCDKLVENDALSEEDVEDIFNGDIPAPVTSNNTSKYSKQEVDALFQGM